MSSDPLLYTDKFYDAEDTDEELAITKDADTMGEEIKLEKGSDFKPLLCNGSIDDKSRQDVNANSELNTELKTIRNNNNNSNNIKTQFVGRTSPDHISSILTASRRRHRREALAGPIEIHIP